MAIDGHHSGRRPLSPSSPYKIDSGAPAVAPSTRPPPSSLPHTPPPGSSVASPCRPPGALAVGEHHLGPLALSLTSRSAHTRNPAPGLLFPPPDRATRAATEARPSASIYATTTSLSPKPSPTRWRGGEQAFPRLLQFYPNRSTSRRSPAPRRPPRRPRCPLRRPSHLPKPLSEFVFSPSSF
jgi:hypothetical protein